MAAPFQRLCCQAARHASQSRPQFARARRRIRPAQWGPLRPFSSHPRCLDEYFNNDFYSLLLPNEQAHYQSLDSYGRRSLEASLTSQLSSPNEPQPTEHTSAVEQVEDDDGDGAELAPLQIRRQPPTLAGEKRIESFWSMGQNQSLAPDVAALEDDISSSGHEALAQHRQLRELVRLAAWEMPLLSSLAKPFEPPTQEQVLRWRYTTYLGDSHPAARKAVVTFDPHQLTELNEKQREKFVKLAGVRYNPDKREVKMSCESFETQAQNKRYLGDTIQKLITEATDPNADAFEDVPVDTRHVKRKQRYKFPDAWKLTPERQAQLEERRKAAMLEEGRRVEEDRIVSGVAAIEAARLVELKRAEEAIMAEARMPMGTDKMGRREMGQTRVQRP